MKPKNNSEWGKLFLIPTPIGNLADITLRALETLKSIDLLLCEDTRHTQILLDHYQIKVAKLSFYEHNAQRRLPEILHKLESGLNLGLVSDAGMPIISDPGLILVEKLRQLNQSVVALPGANAALTALIGSGFLAIPFTFLGFLPRNSQQIKKDLIAINKQTIIFYESPYRLIKTLKVISQIDPNWQICISRELTKIHEEYYINTVELAIDYFTNNQPKGEFVVILAPHSFTSNPPQQKEWFSLISKEISSGVTPNVAIKNFAQKYHLSRKIVYDVYHQIIPKGDCEK